LRFGNPLEGAVSRIHKFEQGRFRSIFSQNSCAERSSSPVFTPGCYGGCGYVVQSLPDDLADDPQLVQFGVLICASEELRRFLSGPSFL
jgi:hypothetical protein